MSCKLPLLGSQLAWNVKAYFLKKNKRKYFISSSGEIFNQHTKRLMHVLQGICRDIKNKLFPIVLLVSFVQNGTYKDCAVAKILF